MCQNEPIQLSIIVPTLNRRRELRRTLQSVMSQSFSKFELIIVDNGSEDGTFRMLADEFPMVKLIRNEKNLGAAEAKNQGILESIGKCILFLDSDIVFLDKNALEAMVSILESDLPIGEIGGETADRASPKVRGYSITKRNGYSYPTEMDLDERETVKCDFLSTSNCMVRKRLLERVGGFDPYYFWTGEDKELGYRIRKLGYRNIAHPTAIVWHESRSKPTPDHAFKSTHRTRVRFVLKNYPILSLPIFVALELRDLLMSVLRHDWKIVKYKLSAHFWNIFFLPQTFFLRIRKPNFIQVEKKS